MQENLREELEKLGIYQLRMYGRSVGVRLATTFKKADLIDNIINILNGNQEPYVKPTKRGRPTKDYVKISEQEHEISNSHLATDIYGINPLLSPNYAFNEFDSTKKVEMRGIVDIFQNLSGVLVPTDGSKRYAYINEKLISSNKIKRGDFVEGLAYELGDENVFVLTDVKSINGLSLDEADKRTEIVDKKAKDTFLQFKENKDNVAKIFELMDIKIKHGDKILIGSEDRKMTSISAFNFIDILSNVKDAKIVLLGTGITDDFIAGCNRYENVECIGACLGEEVANQLKIIELGIQYVKNLVEYSSNNVICVFLNIDNILNICSEDIKNKWKTNLEKFFMSAGKTNVGTLTVAFAMNVKSDDYFYTGLETGANIYLSACDIIGAKQLLVKFNWAGCYHNDLTGFSVDYKGSYGYLLSSFLNLDKPIAMQQQIEHWVNSGLDKDEIKIKMEEEIRNNK